MDLLDQFWLFLFLFSRFTDRDFNILYSCKQNKLFLCFQDRPVWFLSFKNFWIFKVVDSWFLMFWGTNFSCSDSRRCCVSIAHPCVSVGGSSGGSDAPRVLVRHESDVFWVKGKWHSSSSISGSRTDDYNCSLSRRDSLARPAFSQHGDGKERNKNTAGSRHRQHDLHFHLCQFSQP